MAINLLWTGGWDSTFRLLQILLEERSAVQPWYIRFHDEHRQSSDQELATHERIKAAIARRFPNARALIRDTIITDVNAIPSNPAISAQFERLKAKSWLGSQYEAIARLAEERGLEQLELSVHVDDRIHDHLKGHVRKEDGRHVLEEEDAGDLLMFRRLAFPLLTLTKRDMEQEAKARGIDDILELTWFCFKPDRKGRPCGVCNPCRYTIEEGLGRRVPWQGHVRRRIKQVRHAGLNVRRWLGRQVRRHTAWRGRAAPG